MNQLANPYKLDEKLPPLIHLQADVSQADWNIVFLSAPFRGLQDKIMASLFEKFARQVEKEIPPTPDTANLMKLQSIIDKLNFNTNE